MSTGYQLLKEDNLRQALRELLVPRLKDLLLTRASGHCMRVTDLDDRLMAMVCKDLRSEIENAQAYILYDSNQTDTSPDSSALYVSSTKLVELRNPREDGSLRSPLLVFIPINLRTSAEDSFGVATFEEIEVADIYDDLVKVLLKRVPATLQGHVREILLSSQRHWPWADSVGQARYLLTALQNGIDGESLGAALYELGLVPNFPLFDDPSAIYGRMAKNWETVEQLINSSQSIHGRVVELGLVDKTVQRLLLQLLTNIGIEDPRNWTRAIVADSQYWGLSFNKWRFQNEVELDAISIQITDIDALTVTPDIASSATANSRLHDLIGHKVLLPKSQRSLKVTFQTSPHPHLVQGLHHFSVQIIHQKNGQTGLNKNVGVWQGNTARKSISFTKLNQIEFEEGWHNIRILGWTEDGDPIPLNKAADQDGHESEPFYVLPDDQVEEPPEPQHFKNEPSLTHAKLRLQFDAVLKRLDPTQVQLESFQWSEAKRQGSATETFVAQFGRFGKVEVSVSTRLKQLEQTILEVPEKLASWRIQIDLDEAKSPLEVPCTWPKSAVVDSFIASRRAYFEAVRHGEALLVSQVVDFGALQVVGLAYAEAYQDLLNDLRRKIEQADDATQQQTIATLRNLLAIDTIQLAVHEFDGSFKEAMLVAPTHPLRVLWFVTWAQIANYWLTQLGPNSKEMASAVSETVLHRLLPINFPAMIPLANGRIFTAIDVIHPFWTLYAATTEEDIRGLFGSITKAFALRPSDIGGISVTGDVLASRLRRYLVQHPYIQTLVINLFNPGDATIVAAALLKLQDEATFARLSYEVRMFAPHAASLNLGDRLRELRLSEQATTSSAQGMFATSSGNHLFPKLSLAIHSLDEFHKDPDAYQAHLSLLFDFFPTAEIGASIPLEDAGVMPVHGLIQTFSRKFEDNEHGALWRRQPNFGVVTAPGEIEEYSTLLNSLSKTISESIATIATGMPAFNLRPTITLNLSVDQRRLIHEIHETSDWVFTIDRNLGIEFFDQAEKDPDEGQDRPQYMIDYVPDAGTDYGYQLIITSRSISELEAMLRPTLNQHGLDARGRHAARIVHQLRSLSGRVAMKLISAQTQQSEALGLALARMFLMAQGALINQVIFPLDDHLDLFYSANRNSQQTSGISSLQRTDLALFDLNAKERSIRCNLVEVKCYSKIGELGAFQQLKESITTQVNQTEYVLRYHFDPTYLTPDRPDRLLKTLELSTLIEFYLERSIRYGLMDVEAVQEARQLLAHLEDGYKIYFSRSAIIFDFDKPGTEAPEHEVAIEFHRIGIDLIRSLIADVKPSTEDMSVLAEFETDFGLQATFIPRLPEAAFIAPDRTRLTTTDEHVDSDSKPDVSDLPTSDDAAVQVEESEAVDTQITPNLFEPIHEPFIQASAGHEVEPQSQPNSVEYDIILGVSDPDSPQYGLLGEISGRKVALDLNQTHTISLFGVQGSGKSYTLGSIIEMACLPIPNINTLPSPLATVLFHYSQTQDYAPEYTSMIFPNSEVTQLNALRQQYGASPVNLTDVTLLVPKAKIELRRSEYPSLDIQPIAFAASELKAEHWKFLMGAIGNQSLYLRQINLLLRKLHDNLTLAALVKGIRESSLNDSLKETALLRLDIAGQYIDDSHCLADAIRPGRLVIVDLRDELIEKDEALGLFVVMLQIFADAVFNEQKFNKLVVFDEAHKYMDNPDLVAGLVEVVREMRHKGTSVLIASQDPPSVPTALIELSSQIILHKFNSPSWLKHIQRANAALGHLTAEQMSRLKSGEAYVWSSKATDDAFTSRMTKIRCRPRVTLHGGGTKTAV